MRGEALHQVNNNEDYFEELKRGGQTIKVIIYKMSEELSEGPQNILSELEGTEHEILRHNIEQIEGQTCIFTFGSDELMVTMSYTSCDLAFKNEGKLKQLNDASIILIAYDEYTGDLADVSYFSSANQFNVSHVL